MKPPRARRGAAHLRRGRTGATGGSVCERGPPRRCGSLSEDRVRLHDARKRIAGVSFSRYEFDQEHAFVITRVLAAAAYRRPVLRAAPRTRRMRAEPRGRGLSPRADEDREDLRPSAAPARRGASLQEPARRPPVSEGLAAPRDLSHRAAAERVVSVRAKRPADRGARREWRAAERVHGVLHLDVLRSGPA